jgi:hypothetical protein
MMATPTQLTRPTPKGPMAVHASPTPLLPAAQPDVLAPSLRRGAHGSTTSMDCLVETDTAPEAPPLHVDTAFTQYVRSDAMPHSDEKVANRDSSGTPHCSAHGGGRRCQHEGCSKGARGDTEHCKAHGGGRRCQKEGCLKSAEGGGTPHCSAHGGDRRCQHEGCSKSARGDTEHCVLHGGGRR